MNSSVMQKGAFFAAVSLKDALIIYGKAPRVHGYEMREAVRSALQKRYFGIVDYKISDYIELVVLVQDRPIRESSVINFCEGRINRQNGYTPIGHFRIIRKDLD